MCLTISIATILVMAGEVSPCTWDSKLERERNEFSVLRWEHSAIFRALAAGTMAVFLFTEAVFTRQRFQPGVQSK
jgi:hypothetical protein